jgi:hypothetical protein
MVPYVVLFVNDCQKYNLSDRPKKRLFELIISLAKKIQTGFGGACTRKEGAGLVML